jgi:hypothetical protein
MTDNRHTQQDLFHIRVTTLPPERETRPTVGLIPTILFRLAGRTMEPVVSEPRVAAAIPIAEATALPELEASGLRYG